MEIKKYILEKIRSLVQFGMYVIVRLITGVGTKSMEEFSEHFPKVFFVNHNSHADFLLLWVSIPSQLRKNLHPIAAKDYWTKSKLRVFISRYIFDAVLVERNSQNPAKNQKIILEKLQAGESFIIFPEGKRNTADVNLLPLKSGIFYMAQANPKTEFVPVWISNVEKVLPKGKFLPVPVLCQVHLGPPIFLEPSETKADFMQRTETNLLNLSDHKINHG